MNRLILMGVLGLMSLSTQAETVRFATFNVSMEAGNYIREGQALSGRELFENLQDGKHPQIRNIAEIIQRVRPDVILLNEFDYTDDPTVGVQAFQKHYLSRSQHHAKAISYPYVYSRSVNTGVSTGLDMDRDGIQTGKAGDAHGFGMYPGQYGMLLLSQYPIDTADIRTFQHFLWKDMPGNLMEQTRDPDGQPWYSKPLQNVLRLSSKSHWDIPININGKRVHILASHPTPPAFDGPEQRNVKRNHDELRFWQDYLSPQQGAYLYDDQGGTGGFKSERFVLVGDLNASKDEGNGNKNGIAGLLDHPRVNGEYVPVSEAGKLHTQGNEFAAGHTAAWRMRADYVLPSVQGLQVMDGGVFWPATTSELHYLVKDRESSSDHRLVWIDLNILE